MACNKKLGNDFEAALCEILSKHDFWAHNLAQNQAGQPADVIAVKRGHAYLIDCKVCSSNGFPLSRVEGNQKLAMSLWKSCGNGEGWFALKLVDEIIMVPHVFLFECGLAENSPWAQNEELVDWIAIQGPKIHKAWEEAGAL